MSAKATAASGGRPKAGNVGPFLIVMVFSTAIIIMLLAGQNPWDTLFIEPLINGLILLDAAVFGQFGLAIILFTVILRLVTIPFTIRQLESTRAMQSVQPKMAEIQKKYKDPKRRQEEMLKLYREFNINPLGCFMPLLIQMVVFIALYRALSFMVGGSPESLVSLSDRLYGIPLIHQQIPLEQHFLWLDLGAPDTTFILPLLVGISTYVQTKMSISPNATPQMQQQQQMMTWMMPLLLVFITLQLPSGVGVYWVVSNVFSVFASYYVYGKRALSWRQILLPTPAPAAAPAKTRKRDGETEDEEDAERTPGEEDESRADIQESTQEEPGEDQAPERRGRSRYGKRRGKRKKRR